MLTRRGFLLSAFSVSSLSLLPKAGITISSPNVLVVSEETCADTRDFVTHLPTELLGDDPAVLIQKLETDLPLQTYDIIFGLTRDSNYFLIDQYLALSAYKPVYEGRHRYSKMSLMHEIRADKNTSAFLKERIQMKPERWTESLSQVPPLVFYSESSTDSMSIRVSCECPHDSPGQLVSWMYKRIQT